MTDPGDVTPLPDLAHRMSGRRDHPGVAVPVAVKLSPYFSATAEMARRLDLSGADGLVLFNRFLQPDIDAETLTATPGVEDAKEVIEYLLAGADVVMTASALLRHGPDHAATLLDGLHSSTGCTDGCGARDLVGLAQGAGEHSSQPASASTSSKPATRHS